MNNNCVFCQGFLNTGIQTHIHTYRGEQSKTIPSKAVGSKPVGRTIQAKPVGRKNQKPSGKPSKQTRRENHCINTWRENHPSKPVERTIHANLYTRAKFHTYTLTQTQTNTCHDYVLAKSRIRVFSLVQNDQAQTPILI